MFKAILFFIFYTSMCFAQQSIPVVNFQTQVKEYNPYINLLGLQDKDALIIRASENIETDTISGSYLVVLSNGEMYRYGVYLPDFKTHVRKIKVINADKTKFVKLIDDANMLDASQLNLTRITTKNDKENISFTNYPNYNLELYEGKKSAKFYSLSAEGYINARADGYQMRERLVQLCKALDFSETIVTNPIELVKAQDTIYIRYKEGGTIKKEAISGGDVLYDIPISKTGHAYLLQKQEAIPQPCTKDFEARHRDAIIDEDFFLKYGSKTSFLNFRVVYIFKESKTGSPTAILPVTIQFIEP